MSPNGVGMSKNIEESLNVRKLYNREIILISNEIFRMFLYALKYLSVRSGVSGIGGLMYR